MAGKTDAVALGVTRKLGCMCVAGKSTHCRPGSASSSVSWTRDVLVDLPWFPTSDGLLVTRRQRYVLAGVCRCGHRSSGGHSARCSLLHACTVTSSSTTLVTAPSSISRKSAVHGSVFNDSHGQDGRSSARLNCAEAAGGVKSQARGGRFGPASETCFQNGPSQDGSSLSTVYGDIAGWATSGFACGSAGAPGLRTCWSSVAVAFSQGG